jgi:hypothetical protein
MPRLVRTALVAIATCLGALLPVHEPVSAASLCAPALHRLSSGQSAPDDVVYDGRRLIFGDDGSDALVAERNGRLAALAHDLHDAEGIALRGAHTALVVEQGLNQLVRIDLRTGRATPWFDFTNTTGLLGVDNIAAGPNGSLLIPDSPNGRLLSLDRNKHLHLAAGGMGRPVGVTQFNGGLAVPDETAGTVWFVSKGHATRMGSFSTPDDVVVFRGALLVVTLGDHALWEVRPHLRLLTAAFAQPQGLTLGPHGEIVVADSTLNALYSVTGLRRCLGA